MLIHRQKKTGYGIEIDWWALGIVMYELLLGCPPFFDRDFTKMCEKILTRPLRFPNSNIIFDSNSISDTSISSLATNTTDRESTISNDARENHSKDLQKSKSKHSISIHAQHLIYMLLQRDRTQRLCCGSSPEKPNYGLESLRRHPFYNDLDWNLMENNDPNRNGINHIKPPFIPKFGKDIDDTRNFDKEFTRMPPKDSPPENTHCIVAEDLFPGFSFSIPSTAPVGMAITPQSLASLSLPDTTQTKLKTKISK